MTTNDNDTQKLRTALRAIDAAMAWYVACHGAVSHDDVRSMVTLIGKEIDGVRNLLSFGSPTPNRESEA